MSANLPNKMSWASYKKSSMSRDPIDQTGNISKIYQHHSDTQKARFNAKYYGIAGGDTQKDLLEADIAAQLTKQYISTYLQPALDRFSADFASVDSKKGSKYVSFQELLTAIAKGQDSGINVDAEIRTLHTLLDKAEKFISFEMPAELVGVLTTDKDAKAKIAAAGLDTATAVQGNPAAVTSYANVLKIYEDIKLFVDNGMKGTLTIGNGEYVKQNFLDGKGWAVNKKTKVKEYKTYRKNEISSRFGGYMGQITGQIFETMATKKMAEALLSVAQVANVGAVTGSGGTKQKDDLSIDVDGKKLNIAMSSIIAAANINAPDRISFNDSISTGLSAKKKEMKKTNTFLQTGLDGFLALYAGAGGNVMDDYALTLRHGVQLGLAGTSKELNMVNRYMAAKAANLVLGDTVDFMVFLDVVVPKYEFLSILSKTKTRWLYFFHKNTDFTDNPGTVSGEVKN